MSSGPLAVATDRPALGTPGRLGIFAWTLLVVTLLANRLPALVLLGLAVNALLYPSSIRRLLRWRWLIFALLLVLPGALVVEPRDLMLLGVPFSREGLWMGINMAGRAIVVMLAVDGLSSSVDISEAAGLLERIGLPGIGFSMGIAVNLLPALRHSSLCAWRSLRMRGGLRRRWWRGIRLILVTVVANAIRRSEEIALAAESRGYTPEHVRPLPINRGSHDGIMLVGLLLLTAVLLLLL